MNKMKRIYADHAATTKLSEKAFAAMKPYLEDVYHNPSTLYLSARQPRKAVDTARRNIADIISASSNEIFFTSGGTESDNWAIKSVLFSQENKRKKIVTSQIEHHAVLNSCKVLEKLGYEVVYLPVDNDGIVHLEELDNIIDEETALVSIMYANNEIGSIQEINKCAKLAHKKGAFFHTDAVQAVGHVKVDVKKMDIDMLSASAHKFNGPKGIGFLYIKDGIKVSSLITGGRQEQSKRAGTENIAGIVGMEIALRENIDSLEKNQLYMDFLTKIFFEELHKTGMDFIVNGARMRIPGIISVSFAEVEGEMLLHRLDLKGIEVATGSACDSSDMQISHVIRAIGVPEKYARGTVRISLGNDNSAEDVITIVKALEEIIMGK